MALLVGAGVVTPWALAAEGDLLATGVVWVDANDDGAQATTGLYGEVDLPVPGVTVTLHDGDPAAPICTTTTDAAGVYAFGWDECAQGPGPFTVTVSAHGLFGEALMIGGDATQPTTLGDFPVRDPLDAQVASSAPFAAPAEGDPPVVLDARLVPDWELAEAFARSSTGYNGYAITTGQPPFDADDTSGNDSSASNGRVRAGDLVTFNWIVTAYEHVSGLADHIAGVTGQQYIDLGPGAVANFDRYPAMCIPPTTAGSRTSIVAMPSGTAIAPRTDPPAGTTQVVLTCDQGTVDTATWDGQIFATQIWVSGNSVPESTFTTHGRVYAVDVATGIPLVRPTEDNPDNNAGPFTISSAPRWDLAKSRTYAGDSWTGTFDGVPYTTGRQVSHNVTISAANRYGNEALPNSVTFIEDFWAQYDAVAGSIGAAGDVIPDLKYEIVACRPTVYNANAGIQNATAVWGEQGGGATAANTVAQPGSCSFERADPTDLSSPYQVTISGIDTTGKHYPTQRANGTPLADGPFYAASFTITVVVPYSEFDRLVGEPTDEVGSLVVSNSVTGFDPMGVSGTVSNYGDGVEPGYCEPRTDDTQPPSCNLMPDGVTGSNNTVPPVRLYMSGSASWGKGLQTGASGLSAVFLYESTLMPGQIGAFRVRVYPGAVSSPQTHAGFCDVFDNSTMQLVPFKASHASLQSLLPDDFYAFVNVLGPTSSDHQTNAEILASQDEYVIEYGHFDLTGNIPNTGVWSATQNVWVGDWTVQRDAANACKDIPDSQWYASPDLVPGGIDEVNAIRARVVSDRTIPNSFELNLRFAVQLRDVFYGGPNDGELIPNGTRAENFAIVRTDQFSPGWTTNIGRPSASVMSGVVSDAAYSAGYAGWVVQRAVASIQTSTVLTDVLGTPSEGVAPAGSNGTALAGRPIVWQVNPTLTTTIAEAVPTENVRVEVTLPAHAIYDAVATGLIEGGTPATSVTANADGTTTLVFVLGTVMPNEPITPLRIATYADPFAPTGTQLTLSATVLADGILPVAAHTDTHLVTLDQLGGLQVAKYVDQNLDLRDGEQTYTLRLENLSESLEIEPPTVYDIFSYNGDVSTVPGDARVFPGSGYVGTHTLVGAPQAFLADGVTPAAGTFYYTTHAPDLGLPRSLDEDTDPSIWSTEFSADATAIKFVAANSLAIPGITAVPERGLQIVYTLAQDANWAGNLYANRFNAFSDTFYTQQAGHLLFASNQTTVRTLGFSVGDLIWVETDHDGAYTEGVDRVAPAGVVVEVYDADTDALVGSTVTDASGRWVVNDLDAGADGSGKSYYAVIPASQFAAGGPLAGMLAHWTGVADADDDLDEYAAHDALWAADPATTGVRTTPVTVSATVTDGVIAGDEPLGDNLGPVELSTLTTDAFTNLTLDIALLDAPVFDVDKTAAPASGSVVSPGDPITYTVTGTNTSTLPMDVEITDDLSGVLTAGGTASATLTGAVVASMTVGDDDPVDVSDGLTTQGTEVTWAGTVPAGAVVTLTYTVQVADSVEVEGLTLANAVAWTADPVLDGEHELDPLTGEDGTEHEITVLPHPGLTTDKTADPSSGTTVQAGDRVTYTLTAVNTGNTTLAVELEDDLTGLTGKADLDGAPVVQVTGPSGPVGGQPAAQVADGVLTWAGTLGVGETLTVTYTVTVRADATGTLANGLTVTATPPDDGDPLEPPVVITEHPVAAFELTKSSVPGETVLPGQVITYSITGGNTGDAVLDPVTIVDDLSGVLAHATLLYGPTVSVNGAPATDLPLGAGDVLTWAGVLAPDDVVIITYQVTVDDDAWDVVLTNAVTGTATPPEGDPIVREDDTELTTPDEPGLTVTKTADPATGSVVLPGDTITYTVTATNTGGTVLDPVTVTDDLTDVLDDAALVAGSLTATITDAVGGTSMADAPVAGGTGLSWTGVLDVGETVTVTYQVRVNADAWGADLVNAATGTGTPPAGDDVGPEEPAVTEHETPEGPELTVTKTADPATGSVVLPGDTITYTVTATNTGGTALNPVTVTDDLTGVLDNAFWVLGSLPTASLGLPPILQDNSWTWTGALAVGESVTITYQVRVAPDAWGVTLANAATGTGTPPAGDDIGPDEPVVTEHETPEAPGLSVTKTANPVTGSVVLPGDTITYTVTATNTGGTVLDPVTVTDDLTDVLDDAALVPGSLTVTAGDLPTVSGNTLTWAGVLAVGESVTITYRVAVNADAWGVTLANAATGTGTPPTGENDDVGPEDPAVTEHETPDAPGLTVTKTADPATGSVVLPGDTITYTVTATNTGGTVLDPVVVTDDLADVLDDATLVAGSLAAAVTGADGELVGTPPAEPVETDGAVTGIAWTGVLGVGESVTITYQVTVNADAWGVTLANAATGTGTPPTGENDDVGPEDPAVTEHETPEAPGLTVTKTANPATGSTVLPGDTITYTVTATNTGGTVLDPVTVTDDLTDVLDDAALVAASLAAAVTGADGEPVDTPPAEPVETDGAVTGIAWTGVLAVGEQVTITYQVTVNADAWGVMLANSATGTGTPPTGENDDVGPEDPAVTEHETPEAPGLSVIKTADPVTGSTVLPGDTITYTVTATNTGGTVLDPVVVTDDLTDVLDDAALVTASLTTTVGNLPTVDGNTLTWAGVLGVGEQVTIAYQVRVNADAWDAELVNAATGTGTPPTGENDDVGPEDPAVTEHETPEAPGLTVTKTADPAAGTTVEPGDTITYTVTATNTGGTVLDPVTVTDDLTDVLDDAQLDADSLTAQIIGADGEPVGTPPAEPVETDGTVTGIAWAGVLDLGESVTITYQVTVNADAWDAELVNSATANGTPPTGEGDDVGPEDPAVTEHTTGEPPAAATSPGLTVAKTIEVDGAKVATGTVPTDSGDRQVTATATNTGDEPVTGVTFADTTTAGPAVTGWQCAVGDLEVDVVDGALTVDGAALTLAPDDTLTCTGTLPPLADGQAHEDTAEFTGHGLLSGKPITGTGTLRVTGEAAPTTPTPTPSPSLLYTGGTTTGTGSGSGDTPLLFTGGPSALARTGMTLALALVALVLTSTGAGALGARRQALVGPPGRHRDVVGGRHRTSGDGAPAAARHRATGDAAPAAGRHRRE